MSKRLQLDEGKDIVLLDVRTSAEYQEKHIANGILIPLDQLRQRASELPRDKEIVEYSETSRRAYEGSLLLRTAGFQNVRVLDGGIEMWPYEVVTECARQTPKARCLWRMK